MTRDYKPRNTRKQRRGAPAWLWALAGVVVGAFVTGLVWLRSGTPGAESEWIGAAPDDPPRAAPRKPREPEIPAYKPRYQFYDELRRKEVVIPEEQLDARPLRDRLDPTARYLLQVGSFARAADAERLKAELALLGIETRILRVRLDGGRVLHRVQAGPFLGRSQLDRARAQLRRNGYRDLLVRIVR